VTFPHSWFQSRWQSLCEGLVLLNHLAFKETLQKISQTLQNHCPAWYFIVYSPASRVYMLCSSSLLCVHAWTCHIQHFLQENTTGPTLVIIDGEPEYEITWIVDSKINHQWACKLLYKVIWLGYEDTGDKSEWILTSKLTHAADLVSNFHIAYSTKLDPLPLSWTCCCICPLPPRISNRDFSSLIFSIFCLLIFINPQLLCTFCGFFQNFQTSFHFNSWFPYLHI